MSSDKDSMSSDISSHSSSSSESSQSSQSSNDSKKVVLPKKIIVKKPVAKVDKTGTKKASEIYQKMEHAEHIRKKPDTYVGSCEQEDSESFIYTGNEQSPIQKKLIKLTPGFYKCFDELLVNAHDHKKRMDKEISDKGGNHFPVTSIKVEINEDNSISFYNDGDGILIEFMENHKMFPPELIFGTLLTSTNYDDNEKREWGGRNGYGAKLANIFGKRFEVETICHINEKKFKQTFRNNMSERDKPKITSCKSKPYTKITWLPDYERFGMGDLLNDDIKALVKKRVYDVAGVTDKDTKVYFNGKILEIKSFDKYVDLYIGAKNDKKRIFEENNGWQVVATSSDDDVFEQVSFVNGINTPRGGTHVEYIADQIKSKLADFLKKKKKLDVKPQIVKNQLKVFVNAFKIVNPIFDGQTKETLKTPKSKFGSTIEISEKFIIALSKTDIFDKIQQQSAYKNSQLLSKTDGKKSKKVRVNKLSDANKAGTTESKDCTIIFTEGDSAKTMAISGLAEVGRDYYGVFPLRGKILNVRDAATAQIMNCVVLNDIKQIIGLQNNIDYKKQYEKTGVWPLRYGKVMIMTDQDPDGSHIKGLMMNMFDSMWKSLLEIGFITSMVTPIVKGFKGKDEKVFYTLQDYDKWKETDAAKGYRIKYYKGLGTSTTKEAKEYFRKLKIITYNPVLPENEIEPNEQQINTEEQINKDEPIETGKEQKDKEAKKNRLDLAFNKKRSNDRKSWLMEYDKSKYPDFNRKQMTFKEFVDDELIHFSNEDNDRSIPNMMDGLKPSQRKVLYASFKRKLKNEVKVAQLAGYISEHAAYHHGEVSLENTIKNMAQDYVGSNNINYLEPIGQFGTRLMGGDDAAQSRYIFTKLSNLTRALFREEDDRLCKTLNDDGFPIEPEYYYPIIPALLINGSSGIGTGFSTDIPKYNPVDLCKYILNMIDGKDNILLKPWYRGFNGQIESTSPGSYITRGKFQIVNDGTICITELPIGIWTEKYMEYLDKISVERGKETAKNFVRSFKDDSTEKNVNITVKINPISLKKWYNKIGKDGINELENRLKLTSSISITNMHSFNENCKMTKFKTVEDIIERWFNIRKEVYVKRREYLLEQLKKELDIIKFKVKFIMEIIAETIEIRNVKKKDIIDKLEENGYPKIVTKENTPSYDYLLGMDLYKLTSEEIEELKKKKELKQIEYDTLFGKTSTELWKEDIEEFLALYKKNLNEYMKEFNDIGSGSVVIKKKPKTKLKK